MHSRIPFDRHPDAGNTAPGAQCTSCQEHNFDCDRARPACGECLRNGSKCQYPVINTILAEQMHDPLQIREMEARLKKIETQLVAHSAAGGSNSGSKRPMQDKTTNASRSLIKPTPEFSIGPGGLCVQTDITEVHHFVKVLFNAIDVEKIEQRAHAMFDIVTPIPENAGAIPELTAKLMPQLLSMDDQIEEAWLDMVMTSRHHRCLIIYQMVGRERVSWPTSYLRQLAAENRFQELLLAMSMRAYIYQHENELHQDSEFSFRTLKSYDYVQCAKILLDKCFLVSSRITIRALLHLFLFHIHHRPEESFQYSDLAIRMALDLKLHKISQGRDDEDDRRLWWAVYWCHMYVAVLFDRPFMTMDEEIEIDFPCKLPEEEADVGYCIDYCIMSIKLMRIHRKITQSLRRRWEIGPFLQCVRLIEEELDAWKESLPDHARVDTNRHEQDNLCIELGMILNSQLQGTKIQLYQCFLENSQPLSLVAIQSCNKALICVADMLIRHGHAMRMCGCIRILPALHQSIAVIAESSHSKESLAEFRLLQSALISHSFSFLKEIRAIADLIEITLSKVSANTLEASTNSSNNRGSTIITAPEQDVQEGSMSSAEFGVDPPAIYLGSTKRTLNRSSEGGEPYPARVPMTHEVLLSTPINDALLFPGHEANGISALTQGLSDGGSSGSIGNGLDSRNSSSSSSHPGMISALSDTSDGGTGVGHTGTSQWSTIHKKYLMLEQQSTNSSLSREGIEVIPRQEWIASTSSNMNIVGWPTADSARIDPDISPDAVPNRPSQNNVTVQSAPDAHLQTWPDMLAIVADDRILMSERSTGPNPASQHSVPTVGENQLQNHVLQQWSIHEHGPVQQWSKSVETLPPTINEQQGYLQQWPLAINDNTAPSRIHLSTADPHHDLLQPFPITSSSKPLDGRGQQRQDLLQQFSMADSDAIRVSRSLASQLTLPTSTIITATTTTANADWPETEPSINAAIATNRTDVQQQQSSNVLLPLGSSFDFAQWPVTHSGQPQQNEPSLPTYQRHMYSQQFSFNSHTP